LARNCICTGSSLAKPLVRLKSNRAKLPSNGREYAPNTGGNSQARKLPRNGSVGAGLPLATKLSATEIAPVTQSSQTTPALSPATQLLGGLNQAYLASLYDKEAGLLHQALLNNDLPLLQMVKKSQRRRVEKSGIMMSPLGEFVLEKLAWFSPAAEVRLQQHALARGIEQTWDRAVLAVTEARMEIHQERLNLWRRLEVSRLVHMKLVEIGGNMLEDVFVVVNALPLSEKAKEEYGETLYEEMLASLMEDGQRVLKSLETGNEAVGEGQAYLPELERFS